MTVFGDQLRALREARSLTQEELAERAGLTAKAIGALERGERRRPYPHTVRALADALGVQDGDRAALVAAVSERGSGSRHPGAPTTGRCGVPRPEGRASARVPDVIGRDGQRTRVADLLVAGPHPLVTLTGPGGVGKTTLARAVVAQASAGFPAPPTWVDLAGVTDAAGVLPAVAAALGVPEQDFDGSAERLSGYLAGRRALVVLDNLEHVLGAAPALAALLQQCPELVVLATSRAPLRVRVEQEVRVAPLDVPDGDDLRGVAGSPSAQLFLDRAAAAGTSLQLDDTTAALVADLCRRVDGIPLALELAASATRVLGLSSLLDRLDALPAVAARDRPERQRSLAASLDWSWGLLSGAEQALVARLSVFLGSFSLPAAEAVADGDGLTTVAALVDHSWVTRERDVAGTERFRLLVPLRQYAAERLTTEERQQALARVADHLLDVVRDLADDLKGPQLTSALDLIEAEVPTIRAALGWLLDEGRADVAAELVWRLWLHLALRGHAREGLGWCERLRDQPAGDEARARWLTAAAGLAYVTGDIDAVRRDGEAALRLARRGDHTDLVAEAAVLAGSGALFAGDLAAAGELLAAAEVAAATAGDRWASAHTQLAVGQVALLSGDLDRADRLLRDTEDAGRALGNAFTLATALNVRATITELRGEHAESAALLAEAAELSVAASISWTFAYVLPALAGVAVRLGEEATGARLFGASASYSAQHAVATRFQATQQLADRDLAHARQVLGDAAFRAAWDAGRDATPRDVVQVAGELSRRARG